MVYAKIPRSDCPFPLDACSASVVYALCEEREYLTCICDDPGEAWSPACEGGVCTPCGAEGGPAEGGPAEGGPAEGGGDGAQAETGTPGDAGEESAPGESGADVSPESDGESSPEGGGG